MFFPCEESYREEKHENSIYYILERSISDGGDEKLSESKKLLSEKWQNVVKEQWGGEP